MLLQPESVLRERVRVQELSGYIASVNAAAETSLAGIAEPSPTSGFIVIAVRPDGRSRTWLDFAPALPPTVDARLRSSMEQVATFKATGGLVVFAINATLWGAAPTGCQGPSPVEWQAVMKTADGPMELEALIERVWPPGDGV